MGAIVVDCSVLSTETPKVRFHLSNDTTSRDIIRKLLMSFGLTARDPRLFYISMETVKGSTDNSVPGVLSLKDENRPLELHNTYRNSRFRIQMRSGGVVKVYDTCIVPNSFYKSMLISRSTTARELVQLMLNYHRSTADVEDYVLEEIDADQNNLRILDASDLPLLLNQISKQATSFRLRTMERERRQQIISSPGDSETKISSKFSPDALRKSFQAKKKKTLRFSSDLTREDDVAEWEREVAIAKLRTNLRQLEKEKGGLFYTKEPPIGNTDSVKTTSNFSGTKEFLKAKLEKLKLKRKSKKDVNGNDTVDVSSDGDVDSSIKPVSDYSQGKEMNTSSAVYVLESKINRLETSLQKTEKLDLEFKRDARMRKSLPVRLNSDWRSSIGVSQSDTITADDTRDLEVSPSRSDLTAQYIERLRRKYTPEKARALEDAKRLVGLSRSASMRSTLSRSSSVRSSNYIGNELFKDKPVMDQTNLNRMDLKLDLSTLEQHTDNSSSARTATYLTPDSTSSGEYAPERVVSARNTYAGRYLTNEESEAGSKSARLGYESGRYDSGYESRLSYSTYSSRRSHDNSMSATPRVARLEPSSSRGNSGTAEPASSRSSFPSQKVLVDDTPVTTPRQNYTSRGQPAGSVTSQPRDTNIRTSRLSYEGSGISLRSKELDTHSTPQLEGYGIRNSGSSSTTPREGYGIRDSGSSLTTPREGYGMRDSGSSLTTPREGNGTKDSGNLLTTTGYGVREFGSSSTLSSESYRTSLRNAVSENSIASQIHLSQISDQRTKISAREQELSRDIVSGVNLATEVVKNTTGSDVSTVFDEDALTPRNDERTEAVKLGNDSGYNKNVGGQIDNVAPEITQTILDPPNKLAEAERLLREGSISRKYSSVRTGMVRPNIDYVPASGFSRSNSLRRSGKFIRQHSGGSVESVRVEQGSSKPSTALPSVSNRHPGGNSNDASVGDNSDVSYTRRKYPIIEQPKLKESIDNEKIASSNVELILQKLSPLTQNEVKSVNAKSESTAPGQSTEDSEKFISEANAVVTRQDATAITGDVEVNEPNSSSTAPHRQVNDDVITVPDVEQPIPMKRTLKPLRIQAPISIAKSQTSPKANDVNTNLLVEDRSPPSISVVELASPQPLRRKKIKQGTANEPLEPLSDDAVPVIRPSREPNQDEMNVEDLRNSAQVSACEPEMSVIKVNNGDLSNLHEGHGAAEIDQEFEKLPTTENTRSSLVETISDEPHPFPNTNVLSRSTTLHKDHEGVLEGFLPEKTSVVHEDFPEFGGSANNDRSISDGEFRSQSSEDNEEWILAPEDITENTTQNGVGNNDTKIVSKVGTASEEICTKVKSYTYTSEDTTDDEVSMHTMDDSCSTGSASGKSSVIEVRRDDDKKRSDKNEEDLEFEKIGCFKDANIVANKCDLLIEEKPVGQTATNVIVTDTEVEESTEPKNWKERKELNPISIIHEETSPLSRISTDERKFFSDIGETVGIHMPKAENSEERERVTETAVVVMNSVEAKSRSSSVSSTGIDENFEKMLAEETNALTEPFQAFEPTFSEASLTSAAANEVMDDTKANLNTENDNVTLSQVLSLDIVEEVDPEQIHNQNLEVSTARTVQNSTEVVDVAAIVEKLPNLQNDKAELNLHTKRHTRADEQWYADLKKLKNNGLWYGSRDPVPQKRSETIVSHNVVDADEPVELRRRIISRTIKGELAGRMSENLDLTKASRRREDRQLRPTSHGDLCTVTERSPAPDDSRSGTSSRASSRASSTRTDDGKLRNLEHSREIIAQILSPVRLEPIKRSSHTQTDSVIANTRKTKSLTKPSLFTLLGCCEVIELTIDCSGYHGHGLRLFESTFSATSGRALDGRRPAIGQRRGAFQRVQNEEIVSVLCVDSIDRKCLQLYKGRLQEGDFVLEVNGESCLTSDLSHIGSMLDRVYCGVLDLVVARRKLDNDQTNNEPRFAFTRLPDTDLEKQLVKLQLDVFNAKRDLQQKDKLIDELRTVITKQSPVRQVKDGMKPARFNINDIEDDSFFV